MTQFTTVSVNVNGNKRQFNLEDGICIQDSSNHRYLLKDGKWYKKESNERYFEPNRGFLGIGNIQPKMNMTEAQMQCFSALMNNDGKNGLSAEDIAIGQEQFQRGELGADFAEFLTDDVRVKKAAYDDDCGIYPDCISIRLSNGNKFYVDKENLDKDIKDIKGPSWFEKNENKQGLAMVGMIAVGIGLIAAIFGKGTNITKLFKQ